MFGRYHFFVYVCFHSQSPFLASDDFLAETNQVTFPVSPISSSRQCINFTIINDDVAIEGNETFVVELVPPPNVLPGDPTETEITIVDNDGMVGYCTTYSLILYVECIRPY